ncbi:MAG: hypothetical protein Q8O67_22725 [Deltaproteobacteria bacterium]|nr:hypothetical protein [Deltaproteobacteria bacterium]
MPTSAPDCSGRRVAGGLVTIATQADMEALADVCSIPGGTLIVTGTALTTLSLPLLEYVRAEFTISNNSALVSIDLPALVLTQGDLLISNNPALESISMPAMRSFYGRMGGAVLTSIELPALEEAHGNLAFVASPALATFSLPALRDVRGNLRIGLANVQTLTFPSLTDVGIDVDVSDNASLTSVSFPSLATVEDSFRIVNNEVLTSISAPELQAGSSIAIFNDPALTSCTGASIVDFGDCVQ